MCQFSPLWKWKRALSLNKIKHQLINIANLVPGCHVDLVDKVITFDNVDVHTEGFIVGCNISSHLYVCVEWEHGSGLV